MAAPRWASLDRSCDQYGIKLRADHGGSSPGGVLERAARCLWAGLCEITAQGGARSRRVICMANAAARCLLGSTTVLLILLLLLHETRLYDASSFGDSTDAAIRLLQCPPGHYHGAWQMAEANAKLRAHWKQLLKLGYRPRVESASFSSADALKRAEERGFLTYESGLWPRPAHCNRADGPRAVVDIPPGTCEPNGTVCDKYRISRRRRFIWHHVWKGGTTALSPYLTCNLGADPVAGLLHGLPKDDGYLHVGTSREPMRRFLSAFQEVFLRVRVRQRRQRALGEVSMRGDDRGGEGGRGGSGDGGSDDRGGNWCRHAKLSLRVVPGQSWGLLSEAQVSQWKRLRCDRFFCEPSPMEAVGTYHCVPLKGGAQVQPAAAHADGLQGVALAAGSTSVQPFPAPPSSAPHAIRPGEEPSARCHHRRVPWLLVATHHSNVAASPAPAAGRRREQDPTACTDADVPLSRAALRAVFRQLVADVECGTQFANGQHLYSQSLFLGGNTSRPRQLDMLLRLESLSADLGALKRRVGYAEDDKCPLRRERSAEEKPAAVPRAGSLRSLLVNVPGLLQSVCNIYMQDYICLGYPLPSGCELLPAEASRPPATMNVTASSLFGEPQHRRRRHKPLRHRHAKRRHEGR